MWMQLNNFNLYGAREVSGDADGFVGVLGGQALTHPISSEGSTAAVTVWMSQMPTSIAGNLRDDDAAPRGTSLAESRGNLVLPALCWETNSLYSPCLCTHGGQSKDAPRLSFLCGALPTLGLVARADRAVSGRRAERRVPPPYQPSRARRRDSSLSALHRPAT